MLLGLFSRTTYVEDEGFEGETQLLKPVSLDVEVQRNLSSNWYHSIPDIGITAHLKPMSVSSSKWLDEGFITSVLVFVSYILICAFDVITTLFFVWLEV